MVNVDIQQDRNFSTVVTRLRAAGCVYAEDEARLLMAEANTPVQLAAMIDQRAAGFPSNKSSDGRNSAASGSR